MLKLRRSRRDYGYDWNYYPHSKYYKYYKDVGSFGLYFNWPFGRSSIYNYQILPYPYMTEGIPSEQSFRNVRTMISLLRKPRYLNRGYDFDYYPHSRFYQRYREYGDLSLYFGWPLYSPAITTPVSPYFYDLIPSSDSFRSIRILGYKK
ncbi:unnamed protein product [Brassicogethes aeneus]|uniref:Uncharacterized protein n=1 Tax=Brassicogethes aeneus TaxID=1431903 RepID=A0A9P0AWM0_BRAAE|nr:unnamed protein product [Brassicogethes aeneus]